MKNSEREDKEYEGKKEFRECMKEAIKSSLSYLKKKAEREQIVPSQEYDFEIDINKRSWKTLPESRPPLVLFVEKNLEEILKLAEVASCMDFMIKEIVKDVETVKNIIEKFLKKYVETIGEFDYDEITFNNLYRELEEYIYTEEREIIVIAPLLNFELKGSEKIDLGDFIIRKISEEELKVLVGKGVLNECHFYPYGGHFKTIWCIELTSKRKRENLTFYIEDLTSCNKIIEDLEPRIEKVITALRLFKKGSIYYSAIISYPKIWRDIWIISSHERGKVYGQYYELTDEDVENFKTFWSKFKTLQIKKFDVAIRRFNFSYERKLPEDKLIDYIIAFEALFKGARSKLLALRCAYLLGKDGEERKKIFEILESAYDIRNKIVHGGSIESIKEVLNRLNLNLAEFSMQVEEYLRESIKTFLHLQKSKSHDKIIKEIDEKIITGFG